MTDAIRPPSPEQSEKITVLKATVEDAPGIEKLQYDSWMNTFPSTELDITKADIHADFEAHVFTEEARGKFMDKITNPPAGLTSLVAKRGSEVVGYCRVEKRADENELVSFHVLPNEKGKGIGGTLWRDAQQYLDMSKKTILWVAGYNADAIAVYEHLGFVKTEDKHDESLTTARGVKRARPMIKMQLDPKIS